MVIWAHSLTETLEERIRTLAKELLCRGIETTAYDWSCQPKPGVLIIDSYNDQVCGFLREASAGGNARILVLALKQENMTDGKGWELLHAGASDVMVWEEKADVIENLAARFERWNAVDEIFDSPIVRENLVGRSTAWTRVLRAVIEIARFTSSSVLISGESGTGKELIARLIHTLDSRGHKGDLIILDCTTVVPELSGSEFFGHDRGAFTGAISAREGAFARADGGTLFLDEVGELPHTLQAELLRVVQEHTYKRVGSNTWQKTDFRLVSASNRELRPEGNGGRFRPDLYYRLATWSCHLPPLRERREDIPTLASHFAKEACSSGQPPRIGDDVLKYLVERNYPGNIRELRQSVQRMVRRHTGRGPITVGDVAEEERPKRNSTDRVWCDGEFERAVHKAVVLGATIREISGAAEDVAVRGAVAEENGSWHRAAKRLGLTDRALQLRRAAWRLKANRAKGESKQIPEEKG